MQGPQQPLWLKPEDVSALPKGWQALPTEDVCIQLKPGKLFDTKTALPAGRVPILNQSASGFIGYHDEAPGVEASRAHPVVTFANHTCELRLMRQPFSCIQNIFPKVGKPGVIDTEYFFYATQGRVGLTDYKGHHPLFRQAIIPVPPLATQRRIASILGAYDDLIEVNRRRIAVLEEMARRLFEEWFVRVASKAATDDGEGPLPAGWSMQRLGELIRLDKGVSYSGDGLTPDGDPLVNLKNILAGGGFRADGLKRYSGEVKPRHCVVPGDLVMANTDLTPSGGVIGNAALVPMIDRAERIALTHHLFAVRPLHGSPVGRHYLCHWLNSPRFKSYARGHANGATVLGLRADSVLAHPILVPPGKLARRFEDFASSNHVLAQNLVRVNQRLAASRDLLIPRLISGDLSVTAAERELEAVA